MRQECACGKPAVDFIEYDSMTKDYAVIWLCAECYDAWPEVE